MRRLAVLPLLALSAAALSVAGCGETDNSKDYTGARKDVATAIDDISTHGRKLEARKICDGFMTTELKAQLAAQAVKSGRGTDCADQLKDSLRDTDVFEMDVKSIAVAGDTATVKFTFDTSADPDPAGTLELVNQRGWRLSKLP
ncbi:MAG TPA: hypothetical protein VFB41_01820 [Solirubrobacteraceae bacterium]|nr:hypothetical protein [Solirubrobacteraceae bacterium]